MVAGAKLAFDPAHFYVWRAPGSASSIHLSLEVVEKLTQELVRAAGKSPPHDIRGVLLGRTRPAPQPASVVEDVVVPGGNDKNKGTLTTDDDSVSDMICKIVRGARSGQHVVGFFRSQRDGPLVPNDFDLISASRLLGEPDNLLLLIRFQPQGGSEAVFFDWEHGNAKSEESCPPFPFDVSKLCATYQKSPVFSDPAALLSKDALAQLERPARSSVGMLVWLRLALTFGFFVLVTLGIVVLWASH